MYKILSAIPTSTGPHTTSTQSHTSPVDTSWFNLYSRTNHYIRLARLFFPDNLQSHFREFFLFGHSTTFLLLAVLYAVMFVQETVYSSPMVSVMVKIATVLWWLVLLQHCIVIHRTLLPLVVDQHCVSDGEMVLVFDTISRGYTVILTHLLDHKTSITVTNAQYSLRQNCGSISGAMLKVIGVRRNISRGELDAYDALEESPTEILLLSNSVESCLHHARVLSMALLGSATLVLIGNYPLVVCYSLLLVYYAIFGFKVPLPQALKLRRN